MACQYTLCGLNNNNTNTVTLTIKLNISITSSATYRNTFNKRLLEHGLRNSRVLFETRHLSEH